VYHGTEKNIHTDTSDVYDVSSIGQQERKERVKFCMLDTLAQNEFSTKISDFEQGENPEKEGVERPGRRKQRQFEQDSGKNHECPVTVARCC